MPDHAEMFAPLSATRSPSSEGSWTVITPVPDDASVQMPPHRLGHPSGKWAYLNEDEKLLFMVFRFDKTGGGKEVLPLSYCEDSQGNREWRWKGHLPPRPLFGLDQLSMRPDAPVLIVEGEKTADAAQALFPKYVVITSAGGAKAASKTSWKSLSGRDVTICPDQDDGGTEYAQDVAGLAQKAGAVSVAIVHLPAEFPAKWDLADIIPDGWDLAGIEKLLAEALQVKQPVNLTLGSDIEISRCIGEYLESRYGPIVVTEGLVWRYNETHWVSLTDAELRRVVHRYDGATYATKGIVRLSRGRVDSILNEFMAMHDDINFFIDALVGINCLSGFILFPENTADPVIVRHSPEQRCRHVIQARWPANLPDDVMASSLLAKLLQGCFQGDPDAEDKVNLLAEVTGAAVLGKGTQLVKPKAIVFKGDTAENGKSEVINAIRGLLPSGAVSAISLGKFNDERYVCGLNGMLLNACDELTSAAAIQSDTFKQIITGEPITSRDVYRSAVTFRPVAQHLFATNNLPSFKGGMDRGVQRRLLVLIFNRTIPEAERIEHIGMRVAAEETDLLLDWSVKGAQRLLNQRFFTEPASSKTALKDWLHGTDPVLAWLEEGACIVPDAKIKTKMAYDQFKTWAIEEGFRETTLPAITTFSARVLAAGKGVERSRTNKGRYLIGLHSFTGI
jgi:putative DNA primase/helicase